MLCLLARLPRRARGNLKAVAREAIKEIGYNDPNRRFNAAGVSVLNLFSRQAAGIACGVDNGNDLGAVDFFSREMAPLPAQGTSQGNFHGFGLSRFLRDARFQRSECVLIASIIFSIIIAVATPGRSEPRAALASERPSLTRSCAGLPMTV